MGKLFGVSQDCKLESANILREDNYVYIIEAHLSIYNNSLRIKKNSPMLALTPQEAWIKFKKTRLAWRNSLQKQLIYVNEDISKAEDALRAKRQVIKGG